MGTRSFIGKRETNGMIRAIYCHADGFIQGVGASLVEHYATAKRVDALLTLGDLSELGADIGTRQDWAAPRARRSDGTALSCVAYSRDRGDAFMLRRYTTVEAFLDAAHSVDADYVYLFDAGEWYVVNGLGERRQVAEALLDLMDQQAAA